MILFHSETNFRLSSKRQYKQWINQVARQENKKIGDINYLFCDDEYLLKVNQQYLQHHDFTDIITFDYSEENTISGDIMISVERVLENAKKYEVSVDNELLRVMAHGILHLCGYKDKEAEDAQRMRKKEDEAMKLFEQMSTKDC